MAEKKIGGGDSVAEVMIVVVLMIAMFFWGIIRGILTTGETIWEAIRSVTRRNPLDE